MIREFFDFFRAFATYSQNPVAYAFTVVFSLKRSARLHFKDNTVQESAARLSVCVQIGCRDATNKHA